MTIFNSKPNYGSNIKIKFVRYLKQLENYKTFLIALIKWRRRIKKL